MALAPMIETQRLILRPPEAGDFDGYAELFGDEEATRYVGGVMPRAAAWRKFLEMPGAWAIQGFGMFGVIEKQSGRWIGNTGPWHPEGWPGTEVGWMFLRSSWSKGYASEAATAAIGWAFEHLGWVDVIHSIHPDNRASQVLAQRLGATNRGPGRLPAPYQDAPADIWGQTREHWFASRDGKSA